MILRGSNGAVSLATGGLAVLAASVVVGCGGSEARIAQAPAAPTFTDPRTIDNPYLPVTTHARCELSGENVDGEEERSIKTVLDGVKTFDAEGRRVDAVIVQDDAYEDSKLVETTLDYLAQADDGTVHYMGEQVKNLKDGKVVDTEGTWLYGKDTDRMGVAMPAQPTLGLQWRFEDVPGLTMESNRVEEVGLRAKVDGRIITDAIRVSEFIQPEGETEHKVYAPGIGSIAEYSPDAQVQYAGCA